MKHDWKAIRQWPKGVYESTPKSVFAMVAWHLANAYSGEADTPGAAESAFADELSALVLSGHVEKAQATRVLKALTNAIEEN